MNSKLARSLLRERSMSLSTEVIAGIKENCIDSF